MADTTLFVQPTERERSERPAARKLPDKPKKAVSGEPAVSEEGGAEPRGAGRTWFCPDLILESQVIAQELGLRDRPFDGASRKRRMSGARRGAYSILRVDRTAERSAESVRLTV